MDNLNVNHSTVNEMQKNIRSKNVTDKGTPIINKGEETDKDLFIKILVAQMSNQDPMNPQDPTEYVSQLAQFAELEQSMRLNNAMDLLIALSDALVVNSAMGMSSSLVGKHIEVSEQNENKENYKGVVQSARIEDGVVYLDIKLDGTEEIKSFEYGSLIKISEVKKES